jgi:four helix bundle protein
MTEDELKARLKEFALRILALCDALPNTRSGRAIANQLVRSGTSPGANYRAACRARSVADFVGKLAIAEEEMDESYYWLDLIISRRTLPPSRVIPLFNESEVLTKILSSSRYTASLNEQRRRIEERKIKNQKSKLKNPRGGV